MSVVLLESVHVPSTFKNLFWYSHLDCPLENTSNSLENILQPLMTFVAYYIYKNVKYLKCNFFIQKDSSDFYLPLEHICMSICNGDRL